MPFNCKDTWAESSPFCYRCTIEDKLTSKLYSCLHFLPTHGPMILASWNCVCSAGLEQEVSIRFRDEKISTRMILITDRTDEGSWATASTTTTAVREPSVIRGRGCSGRHHIAPHTAGDNGIELQLLLSNE